VDGYNLIALLQVTVPSLNIFSKMSENDNRIKVAILGVGMMGQEHISYIQKFSDKVVVKYICDPNSESIETALSLITNEEDLPAVYEKESELRENHAQEIDLLVIATPNYLHTPQLLKWAQCDMKILCEKPVAISEQQVKALRKASPLFKAKIWVAMEYRYMPAIQKLLSLLPTIGELKCVTIRENRYPFLSKVGEWNKDLNKTGDTLVEKCCHFFDLFSLFTDAEMHTCYTKIQRGINRDTYKYAQTDVPIIDAAYVLMDFYDKKPIEEDLQGNRKRFNTADNIYANTNSESIMDEAENSVFNSYEAVIEQPLKNGTAEGKMKDHQDGTDQQMTMGVLELCMFAEGSRHQEEIICTGTNGRLEAYLPENKVFHYQRPNEVEWTDISKPPPVHSIKETIYDCSDLSHIYSFHEELADIHAGYHYCSTAVEWKYLVDECLKDRETVGSFQSHVTLADGLRAVEMGIEATRQITNKNDKEMEIRPPFAKHQSKSQDALVELASAGFLGSLEK
jgi:predicted dehydrogenase